ncbi:sugar ABC transporter ATP-binding protein [Acidisoma cellulosilytica]|uniref:Sugar ABC transporter ATP-binding protein n=1 Tax=Acidisoma cellulosilyticum TaxID=2802395 RepID=A0A963Z1W5_9PROT|nr:sugar ABC transporter ATP-binding protein [Acidisoma cellulosilyticum]MCB8881194.1 sugar ABC transporter ATP-binding protein [Acidisoma cellulosilyticum]
MTETLPLPPACVTARRISKSFGGVAALDSVDLAPRPGRVLGLLGANGSGKSTLCRIIAGEMMSDGGELLVDGQPARFTTPKDAVRRGVVIAHQHPSLAPDLPVWENLFLGMERCGRGGFVSRAGSRRAAWHMLQAVGLDIDIDQPVERLSAAEQQLVEIARALSREPRLLILDEPTAALSAALVDRLFAHVRALAASGTAIIFISHRLQEVEALCDDLVVLRNGRRVGSWELDGSLDEARVLDLLTGDSDAPARLTERKPRDTQDVVLTLEGLCAGQALRGVDLDLHSGEILGIAGLQGQGQEQLLDTVAGFRRKDGGRILHRGRALSPHRPRDMIRRGICLVPNDRHRQGLFMDQTVGENLAAVALAMQPRPWRLRRRRLAEFVRQTIPRLLIKTRGPTQPVATLSGGNQQKVVIGKWLEGPVDVLLLSDPTKGVDLRARREIYDTIGDLVAGGSAALVYASDIHELLHHCDRILVMYEGRVVETLSGSAMTEQRVIAASFGRAA